MYIATGQGQTTPGHKVLMSTETSCHFGHLLQVSKKSLWSLILYNFFHDFIHIHLYIAPGQGVGLTTPWWWNFDVNRNILSLRSFVASFKKIALKSDFIQFFSWFYTSIEVWFYTIFFIILYMYIAPGQGQTAPRAQILISTAMSCHFIHLVQVSKKCQKNILLFPYPMETPYQIWL